MDGDGLGTRAQRTRPGRRKDYDPPNAWGASTGAAGAGSVAGLLTWRARMFSFLTEPGTFACLYHTKRMSWDWGMETSSTVYPGPSVPAAWASAASVERQAAAQDGAEVARAELAATAARRGAMGATTATR